MTAFPLFDHFNAFASDSDARLMTVAQNMVSSSIQQFEKITELDEGLAPPIETENLPFDFETALAIRLMYEECAKKAERVIARIDRFEESSGRTVQRSESLRTWLGKTAAMLSVSIPELAAGVDEAARGKLISAGEIRNELRARAHI